MRRHAAPALAAVARVLTFLDLPPLADLDVTPANETSKLPRRRFGGLYRTMVANKGLAGQVKRLLPQPLKDQVWTLLDGLNRKAAEPAGARARVIQDRAQDRTAKPVLGSALQAELAARLRPGIDRLATLLDRDLAHWAPAPIPCPVEPKAEATA